MIFLLSSMTIFAQKRKRPAPPQKPKTIVFAVLNDGKTLEPIGLIDKGALVEASNGSDDGAKLKIFSTTYYKPNTAYKLVFGGADAGTVTVKKNDPTAECSTNLAEASFVSPKARLKGMVMGLATNAAVKKAEGVRRLPTPAERSEIETLVRTEFFKNKIGDNIARNLKYHNLTALDVDSDKKAEMVGSFWVETSPTERALLFFIAEKGANGKYKMGYSEFRTIKQDEVMSGEIKSLDEGIYHELLLDTMEYDGDTTDEIFTYIQSFEGASFNTYSRRDGKWVKAFEGSNYHCGY
ncbi:hypothetical protein Bpfe_031576 [Biomphalaria pfeifferi]|uniref:Uncharacterized protein n=1 Tax=Biomphalaria pfeifferi TaxID=112525 RepID=A0AAD8ETN7_BIOPF|nr:hypothetical protein Bpfe_031576 [Biomphalaria pfeifferi]